MCGHDPPSVLFWPPLSWTCSFPFMDQNDDRNDLFYQEKKCKTRRWFLPCGKKSRTIFFSLSFSTGKKELKVPRDLAVVLGAGTLRFNLDPLNQSASESQLWQAWNVENGWIWYQKVERWGLFGDEGKELKEVALRVDMVCFLGYEPSKFCVLVARPWSVRTCRIMWHV